MSEKTLESVEERLGQIGSQAAWAQWSALGAGTLHEERTASSIIDPEALLLLSLYLIPAERRLRDLAKWWAEVGSDLLSVQRTKTLAKNFPSTTEERIHTYSRWATQAGDKRWRKYAEEKTDKAHERDRKGPDEPKLRSPAALLLRLRAGFGVSAKADVLAFLLGSSEQSVTVKKTVEATGYSRATVSGALEDLSRAAFINKRSARPAEYRAPTRPWTALLWGPSSKNSGESGTVAPTWRYWGQLFAFLSRAREWAREADSLNEYVASTRARDLFAEFEGAFEANRIQLRSADEYRGAEYVNGFRKITEQIIRWIPENL